jgi:hypothetical protein
MRYASVRFSRVRFTIVAFICSLLQYFIELLFVSSYNHLLFLAKTNKLENDNNIDFSLSIEQ